MTEVKLILGDCKEILPTLSGFDALITDPPYGIGWQTPPSPKRPKGGWKVENDNVPFDPSHLFEMCPILVLCGAHHYANVLPPSPGWVVWDKRCGMPSNDQSDADLIWTNVLTRTLIYRQIWNGGGSLLAENGPARAIHPTQKPVALMQYLIELTTKPGMVVLDPYMGSGTTGVACIRSGRNFIGIEITPHHFQTAQERIARELETPMLFTPEVHNETEQLALF